MRPFRSLLRALQIAPGASLTPQNLLANGHFNGLKFKSRVWLGIIQASGEVKEGQLVVDRPREVAGTYSTFTDLARVVTKIEQVIGNASAFIVTPADEGHFSFQRLCFALQVSVRPNTRELMLS